MRRATAENMLHSVTTAPHVTAVLEADFSAVQVHRRRHKPLFERDGINLTITAYLVAACVVAMRAVPTLNSRWHDDRIDVLDDVNIGVGTDLGGKGWSCRAAAGPDRPRPLEQARSGGRAGRHLHHLQPRRVRLSVRGTDHHQPAASAILGVGKLEKRVVVRDVDGADTIQIRPMCYVSLTVDHRVVDGHGTNAWLTAFVDTLEGWPP